MFFVNAATKKQKTVFHVCLVTLWHRPNKIQFEIINYICCWLLLLFHLFKLPFQKWYMKFTGFYPLQLVSCSIQFILFFFLLIIIFISFRTFEINKRIETKRIERETWLHLVIYLNCLRIKCFFCFFFAELCWCIDIQQSLTIEKKKNKI